MVVNKKVIKLQTFDLITIVDANTQTFQHTCICHLTKNTITQLSILLYIDFFHLTKIAYTWILCLHKTE